MSPRKDSRHRLPVKAHANTKLTFTWLGRWMIWVYLLGRELPEMGETSAGFAAIWCAFGSASLLASLMMLSFFSELGVPPLFTIGIGIFCYLMCGLGSFFASRITNAPIHWTRNGGW